MEPDYRYVEAEAELEHLIRSGRWAYGEQLPAREVLAAQIGYGIRTTRRAAKALADPDRDGGPLLRIRPGRGTLVIWRGE